ncbi:hypothetical protein CBR_g41490 [Chara braunii]|uniref:Alpha 1,4-glycosyltransferase domain-containing protein n=1 Tax=Chara braunii TaxID=69332 RepID=A0A388LW08_CHABU|nr:hypothetical protein CBR_g41490 [Chara braunii]|eukprot:GBG86496.1 hypothetical protein CBR_g41490 [Chara braunii]
MQRGWWFGTSRGCSNGTLALISLMLAYLLVAVLIHDVWQFTQLKDARKRLPTQGRDALFLGHGGGPVERSRNVSAHWFLFGSISDVSQSSAHEKEQKKKKKEEEFDPAEVPELPPPSRGPPMQPDANLSCQLVNFSRSHVIRPSDYLDLGTVPSFFTRLQRFGNDEQLIPSASRERQGEHGSESPGSRNDGFLAWALAPLHSDLDSKQALGESVSTSGTPKNVFFFHMYEEVQSYRRLCSIESFLRKNPDYTVYIYAPVLSFFTSTWSERGNPRVRLVKLDYEEIFRGTPFEQWYASGEYEKSRWVKMNLGNACRLAVLWKKGGTYLDLDVISLNPQPEGLEKAVAAEHVSSINCAFLRYPAKDGFLWECMKDFVKNWNGMKWGIQGPQLTSRVYFRFCQDVLATQSWLNTAEGLKISKKSRRTFMQRMDDLPPERLSPDYVAPSFCRNYVVLEEDSVYPIHFRRHNAVLYNWKDQCNTVTKMAKRSFLFHYWDHFFPDAIRFGNDSLMVKLMTETCPNTFHRYG